MNLDFDKRAHLYDRMFKNSETFCMKIRKLQNHQMNFVDEKMHGSMPLFHCWRDLKY